MSERLNNFGALVMPDVIRLTARIAKENRDRKQVQESVVTQLQYPSLAYRQRLKQSAFGFFRLTKTEFAADPFLDFVAVGEGEASLDVIIYRTFKKYPVVLEVYRLVNSENSTPPSLKVELAPKLEKPDGAEKTVAKVLKTLRDFGLIIPLPLS